MKRDTKFLILRGLKAQKRNPVRVLIRLQVEQIQAGAGLPTTSLRGCEYLQECQDLSVVFCPQLCVFWVASSCPSRASLPPAPPCSESLEADPNGPYQRVSVVLFLWSGPEGGTIWRSKRMKKVRNQPLRSLLATLSRVDPAFLQKKQCSPPRRGEDCIHSLGLL